MENTATIYFQVNNAGESRPTNVDTTEVEDLDFCYETLLKSVFMMTKLSLPHLEKTKGKLNIASHTDYRTNWSYFVITKSRKLSLCQLCR